MRTSLSDRKIQLVAPGGFLGRHRVLAQLGQGGMADVFLAVAPGPVGLNKLVVIKRLRDNRQDDEFLGMFMNEAHIAARLNHPNVIHLYEVEQDESQIYLVMEYLDGQPLQRVRGQFGDEGPSLGTHLRILCDSLLGLQYAHELGDYDGTPLGIVHRDMSPHNIFVTYEGTTKILDFGIAKALNQTVHTRVGGVKGKVQFMSPEQARGGSHAVDRRSDVFTMGILLWEAVVGRRLWKGEEEPVVFQHLVRGDPIPGPRSVNPMVHPRLDRICVRALNTDRDKRYASAEELRLDIEAYMLQAGMRITSMDVGRFVSERFCQERKAHRATIDAELRSTSTSLEVLTSPPISGSIRTSSSTLPQPPAMSLLPTDLPVPAPTAQSAIWRTPRRARQLIVAGVVSVSVGAAIWWTARSEKDHRAAAVAIATHAVNPAGSIPTGVKLNIEVDPNTAQVFLDDRPLGIGAFRGLVPRSSGQHQVRAEATGHQSATANVSLESDSTIRLTLTPELPAASSSKGERKAKSSTPHAPPPTQTPLRPVSKKKPPIVSIDTENPW